MPFALNEATRYISPTKTPEFLAAGLPLVSTPVPDVVSDWGRDGLVDIVAGGAGTRSGAVAAALEAALARPRQPWLARVDDRLAGNSWDATWARMNRLMQEAREGRGPAAAREPLHV